MNSTATYTEPVNRIKQRILFDFNLSALSSICHNWEDYVIEISEWGIYKLAGVDFDNSKQDYHSDVKLDEEHRSLNSNLYWHLFKYTKHLARQAKQKMGVSIRSISPLSKLNEHIPYLTLEQLNKEIEMRLPEHGKLYNATELDKLRKEKKKPKI